MEKIYDLIIIGGGPAGYSAALYASRAGLDTLVIEKMSVGGQMALTGDIDNYPGFPEGIDGFTLGMNMQQGAERFGAKTEYATVTALALSATPKRVETDLGSFLARSVIYAAGASPKPLGIPGEEELVGRGVHYCAHCDGRFYRGKTVAVVGGGNSAAEDALYLSNLAERVYLIHRRTELRATALYRDQLERSENVELLLGYTVDRLHTEDGLSAIRIKSTESGEARDLSADALFVSIGRNPETALVKDTLELDPSGYVKADETTKTAIPGVFVAGDVRTKSLRQVVTAVADGAVAATEAEIYLHSVE